MKIKNVKVRNEWGVNNQLIISINSVGTFFQSYGLIIAARTPKGIFLDETYWNYSTTTGKYRNKFLNETTKETTKKIDDKVYKLTNLND